MEQLFQFKYERNDFILKITIKYLSLFIMIFSVFHLLANDKVILPIDYIDVDSVVIVRRLAYNPIFFTKLSVNNKDLVISSYKKNSSTWNWDIDYSNELYKEEQFELYKQLSVSPKYFDEIRHNLFSDLNALFINKTDCVVNNRIKVMDAIINNRVVELNVPGSGIYNYRINIEVFKNNNCQRFSVISGGAFFNENWEVVRLYRNGRRVDEYYVKYSPYFVDFYNLINELITEFDKNE